MRRIFAVLAALALLLVACGASQTSTETSATPTGTAELPTTTSTAPPTTTYEPPETTTTLRPAAPEPPPPTPTAAPLAPVTTGENIPEALSRDLIPWDEVGPGWYLVTYTASFEPTFLYLVDGRDAGVLYGLGSFEHEAYPVDWRLDGSAALIWNWPTWPAPEGPELLLVNIASGEATVLLSDHLKDTWDRPFDVGFTRPSGIHVVARTDDGTTETLAYYDFAGNQLQELYSQVIPEHYGGGGGSPPGRLTWLYGVEGLDVVVGHGEGMALVDNKGSLTRDLWVPDDHFCQPVRWWSEGELLARCTLQAEHDPDQSTPLYWEPWVLRTDGMPGQKLAEIPESEYALGDFGHRDAWPTTAGLLVQGFGDCGTFSVKIVNDTQISYLPTVLPAGNVLVDVVEERVAIHAVPECDNPGKAFYIHDLQTGEANIIIPPIEDILGVYSVLGLATVYP